ncbi:hypothetical protein ACFE04_024062 [Oxalis oulophora]
MAPSPIVLSFRTSSTATSTCSTHGLYRHAEPNSKSKASFIHIKRRQQHIEKKKKKLCASASVDDVVSVSVVADPVPAAEITWQIVVGTIAGVTPFVVAGIEFSKRIVSTLAWPEITQKRCQVCNGSGLVIEEKIYVKCPQCGGFLPWQSWERFFRG